MMASRLVRLASFLYYMRAKDRESEKPGGPSPSLLFGGALSGVFLGVFSGVFSGVFQKPSKKPDFGTQNAIKSKQFTLN